MNSFIIAGKNSEKRNDYIRSLCREQGIKDIDIRAYASDKALGIEDVREIQKQLFLSPIHSEKKAIIVERAETLTITAQNALLKALEEPPLNTLIFLSANRKDNFLPTVISRATLLTVTENEKIAVSPIEENIEELSLGEGLALAQKLSTDKEKLIRWLENLIIYNHKELLDSGTDYLKKARLIKKLQETYNNVRMTNVSARLALENMFIQLKEDFL